MGFARHAVVETYDSHIPRNLYSSRLQDLHRTKHQIVIGRYDNLKITLRTQPAFIKQQSHRLHTQGWFPVKGRSDELWVKGATSGDTLKLVEVRVNCEQNSLLYLVRPLGQGACHTKGVDGKARPSCYYRRLNDGKLEFV